MSIFAVTGMSCNHCIHAVTDSIHTVDAAAKVAVDLPAGRVIVTESQADPAELAAAIEDEGYAVRLVPA